MERRAEITLNPTISICLGKALLFHNQLWCFWPSCLGISSHHLKKPNFLFLAWFWHCSCSTVTMSGTSEFVWLNAQDGAIIPALCLKRLQWRTSPCLWLTWQSDSSAAWQSCFVLESVFLYLHVCKCQQAALYRHFTVVSVLTTED